MIWRARRRPARAEPLEVGNEALRESVRVAVSIAALRVDPCPWIELERRR